MKSARKTPKSRVELTTDPVEVFCRLRPLPQEAEESCVSLLDYCTLQLTAPESPNNEICKQTECKFTQVFCEMTNQKEIFEQVALDLVEDVILGKDGLLLTYGITGSGKTYTMTGSPRESGILPTCLDVIFNSIGQFQTGMNVFTPDGYNDFDVQTEAAAAIHRGRMALSAATQESSTKNGSRRRKDENGIDEWELRPRIPDQTKLRCVDEDNSYSVFVSYIEIYNNYIYDLLDQNDDKTKPTSKNLKEDLNRNKYVGGVTEVEVKSTEQAFDVFIKGQKYRRTAHTVLNTESSRSHSVFNIRLVQAPLDQSGADVMQDKTKVHSSQLSLVDLAGSERTARTGHVGDRIKETGHINTSLMTLRQCIEQLRENQKMGTDKMVPYRDSRMTHLFKNYFEGRGKVKMVVCVNPSAADYDENLHVMQFAEMTQEVEIVRANDFKFEGLTPGRRRAAQFQEEFNAAMDEMSPICKIPATAGSVYFDGMPSVDFEDPTNEQSAMALRRYFEQQMKRRQEIVVQVEKKSSEYDSTLRKFIFDHQSTKHRCEEMRQERMELEVESRKMHSQNRQLQHKVSSLTQRLGKYENNARMKSDQEESFKRKEREMAAMMREKDMKLLQVRNIFNRGTAATLPAGSGTPTKKSNEAIRKVAGIATARFGGSQDSLSKARTGANSIYPSLAQFGRATTNRRGPPPPPKPRPGHINTKYHRRSKSATTIDHQPNNKVPLGTFMQPKLRNAKVRRNRISSEDLNNAAEYVLTHQETEPTTGALRTSLVKGDVIPTSGGGSAVVFNDIEQLTHNSPASKRKSDDSDQNTSLKRSRRAV